MCNSHHYLHVVIESRIYIFQNKDGINIWESPTWNNELIIFLACLLLYWIKPQYGKYVLCEAALMPITTPLNCSLIKFFLMSLTVFQHQIERMDVAGLSNSDCISLLLLFVHVFCVSGTINCVTLISTLNTGHLGKPQPFSS